MQSGTYTTTAEVHIVAIWIRITDAVHGHRKNIMDARRPQPPVTAHFSPSTAVLILLSHWYAGYLTDKQPAVFL